MNREIPKLRKSTLETILRYGFDREALDAEMADYGYTTRVEYGCIAIVDESGVSVDHGKPVLAVLNGKKFGNVFFSEMESVIVCDDEMFFTIEDEMTF